MELKGPEERTIMERKQFFQLILTIAGLATIAIGSRFYIEVRGHCGILTPVFECFGEGSNQKLPSPIETSLPSFLHIVILSLLSAGLMGIRKTCLWKIPLFWFFINVLSELAQIPVGGLQLINGTFDWKDLCGTILGTISASGILLLLTRKGDEKKVHRPMVKGILFVFGIGLIVGSHYPPFYPYPPHNLWPTYEPVYLSYQDLRNSFAVDPPREIHRSGKIFIVDHFLLVSERNEGIHLIDNSNPHSPQKLSFLKIPGNLDLAVQGNLLFADSYVDLLVIEMTSPQDIHLKYRIEDLFPYNEYQNIYDKSVYFSDLDRKKGVVVGYKKKE